MGSGSLVLKIYRERPALLRWVYVAVCSSARASGRSDGMAGEICLVPWDQGVGMWSLGGGRMGVSVFKSTVVREEWKWKAHGLPSGQQASHKENSFGTGPQACTHWRGRFHCGGQSKRLCMIPPSCSFQAYFLHRSHLQAINWLTVEPTPATDNDVVLTKGWGIHQSWHGFTSFTELKLFLHKVLSISKPIILVVLMTALRSNWKIPNHELLQKTMLETTQENFCCWSQVSRLHQKGQVTY